MNNAILIQQCLSVGDYTGAWSGIFYDQLRLTQPRHAAYARAHKMDYWCMYGDVHPGKKGGAWDKVQLILAALEKGYEQVFWLDTDAAIMDMEADLRDALSEGEGVGAVVHDPERSVYLQQYQVPKHMNVGVLYVRNGEKTVHFFKRWLSSWPGLPGQERWAEQGAFNQIKEEEYYAGIARAVEDKWNATVNVNEVLNPVVKGWHGVMPPERRLSLMLDTLKDDFLKFRVR